MWRRSLGGLSTEKLGGVEAGLGFGLADGASLTEEGSGAQ